ncbi:MAG: hypothetical protein MI921_05520 [Cytophagales bacterium]|nr:hypothetical protein [Cytophagales bacterium]
MTRTQENTIHKSSQRLLSSMTEGPLVMNIYANILNANFGSATSFSTFLADGAVVEHIFQFLDTDGNVLASTTLPEAFFLSLPRFNNFTFGLVGRTDDGSGGSDLSVLDIEHF